MTDNLCKDNVICCDDNCKRCANLIYQKYINQKAEIEKLQQNLANVMATMATCDCCVIAKAEAIKEFAERLKKLMELETVIYNSHIDNLVKEMVGDGE